MITLTPIHPFNLQALWYHVGSRFALAADLCVLAICSTPVVLVFCFALLVFVSSCAGCVVP